MSFTFWREQVSDVDLIVPSHRDNHPDPRLTSFVQAAPREQWHERQRLGMPILHWLERERPDLVLLHEERSTATACIQFAARTVGSRVLWTGPGLLPHTMQVDLRGLDAEAQSRRWTAKDYRVVAPDRALLDASLAHAMAGGEPFALPRPEVRVPLLGRRLADAVSYAVRGQFSRAAHAMTAWRDPFENDGPAGTRTPNIAMNPKSVCVLLQDPEDPRVVHDASEPPDPRTLIQCAIAAADAIDPDAAVVAVLPSRVTEAQMGLYQLAGEQVDRVRLVPLAGAAAVAATALVTVTINHPMAAVSLLAGTPVVHLGRALYGLDGVTTHARCDELPDAVVRALQNDRPALRRRFLTFLLQHGHVWCSQSAPNHNGMLGLVQAVEDALASDAESNTRALPYRPGPTWPLATS